MGIEVRVNLISIDFFFPFFSPVFSPVLISISLQFVRSVLSPSFLSQFFSPVLISIDSSFVSYCG